MVWQDIIFTVGGMVFTVALIPSILGKNKPAFFTSIVTAATLTVFSFAYFSLGLMFSSAAVATTSIAWYILAAQKLFQRK